MQTFIELDLFRTGIDDRGMQYLANILQNNQVISELFFLKIITFLLFFIDINESECWL